MPRVFPQCALCRVFTLGLTLLLLVGIISCTRVSQQESSARAEGERRPAPDFELQDHHGKPVRLSDFRGKVVLLNFWATWCAPCRIEIPWFIELQRKYKDKGLVIVGVSMDEEGWSVVRPYIEEMEINYPVVIGDDMVAEQYGGVAALPTTFLIDRQGKIAKVHVGLVSKNTYEREIQELLNETVSASVERPSE